MPVPTEGAATQAGSLVVTPFAHPQGCRSYLIADPISHQALALDVHLDLVGALRAELETQGLTLVHVVDSHTHADHPSGSAALAGFFSSTRIAHAAGGHVGVTRHPEDGDVLVLGEQQVTVRHAPGHTPDHLVLSIDGAVFSGDTLLIGAVARTDFLGGDAGQLHDSIHRVFDELDGSVVLYPGHDYQGRTHSDLATERSDNPWLGMARQEFVDNLTADPPPRPANMDDLLRLNKEAVEIPPGIPAADAVRLVRAGAAASVVDVRTAPEYEAEHVEGSRLVPLDRLEARLDEIRATPAPRLLLCRTGSRARMAREQLEKLELAGLTVIEGGIEAYRQAGGETTEGRDRITLERQVRIAAGSLVLLGLLLAWWIDPLFLLLSAFVGAGLVWAGVTDRCGMALVLARAPWNRASENRAIETGGCAATPPPACAARPPAGD